MRLIEEKILDTLKTEVSGSYRLSCRDSVEIDDKEKRVYLHGNLIYLYRDNKITLWARDWKSNTTKSRLNALLSKSFMQIRQKNWEWSIESYFHFKVNGEIKNRFDFREGITFNLKTMEVGTFGI